MFEICSLACYFIDSIDDCSNECPKEDNGCNPKAYLNTDGSGIHLVSDFARIL